MSSQCLLDKMETDDPTENSQTFYGCNACNRLAKSTKRSTCGHTVFVFKSFIHSRVTKELCRILGIIIGVVTFIIGLRYRHECHFEPAIPVFLMVLGSVLFLQTVFRTLLLFRPKVKVLEGEREGLDTPGTLIKIQVLFLILWVMAGSVWIYSAKGIVQFHNPKTRNFCDKTVFWTSFGMVTASYTLTILIVCYFITTYIVLRLKTKQESERKSSENSVYSNNNFKCNKKSSDVTVDGIMSLA
ncbi:hypothetical protein LOTGIDRAFT_232307 [Lottia gigantea]|uniref:MARVEL domain-containing protein n=1 Tax=Lottia gigantea TaxID=225164 RepID=V3ZSP4_LOTGI|nr:hypothetical protein LOTGIDRAFT_232307 [Lottia gigantea]ESO94468.1 hypothetical protein LOTGIDRAFT_232307 [Lottia gigantea]